MSNPPSPVRASGSAEEDSQEHDEILFNAGDAADAGAASEEEEGEDLLDDALLDDYKAIPELDRYDERDLDDDEHEEISAEGRAEAERLMQKRDVEAARRQGRLPAALDEAEDEEEEEEAGRKRRRIREGEGEDEADDTQAATAPAQVPSDDVRYLLSLDDAHKLSSLEDSTSPVLVAIASDANRLEVKRRFTQFLAGYNPHGERKGVYLRQVEELGRNNRSSLVVSYHDLFQVETMQVIIRWLAEAPEEMLQLLSEAAYDYVCDVYSSYASICDAVHVRLSDFPLLDDIRALRQHHLLQLVMVEGVVTRRTAVYPQLQQVKYTCNKCSAVIGPYMQTDQNELSSLVRCYECQSDRGFTVNAQQTVFRNYQRITLQEPPSSVPAGRVPRSKEVILLHDLIDSVAPGDHVQVTGIYKHAYDRSLNAQHGFPVFATLLVANYVQNDKQLTDTRLTDDDVRAILRLAKEPTLPQRVFASIAPSIYGHDTLKQALALSMLGGTAKEFHNGHRIRGDINVLLLGDPGTAKSQLLKFVEKCSHRSVYTTGKGASAVGLTASVHKDLLTREWVLEGGALVLADQGVCLIDEFDKMNDQDRTSIHEAMEQQSISISKAGIVTTLKARCAVIAAANPISGRYNASVPLSDNVELTDAILSRFDLLCVVRDVVEREADERLAAFVVRSHFDAHPDEQAKRRMDEDEREKAGDAVMQDDDAEAEAEGEHAARPSSAATHSPSGVPLIPQSLLRKYILYAKTHCHPRLDQFDDDKLAKLYARLRKESFVTGGLPISVRHIESIIRLSEAHAKLRLRQHVTAEDVDVGIRLMLESFISSQKFAIMRQLRLTFREYLSAGEDSFELILHALRGMVGEEMQLRVMGGGAAGDGDGDEDEEDEVLRLKAPVLLAHEDVVEKLKELNLSESALQSLYASEVFRRNHYAYDKKRRQVVKTFDSVLAD